MRYSRTLAIAAALVLMLSACSGGGSGTEEPADTGNAELDSLIAAAKEEGKLVVYSVETDEMNNAVAEGFTEKYGIPVEILRLVTGPLLERFAGEQRAGVTNADHIQVVDQNVWQDNADWFVNLDEEPVPGWEDYPESGKHYSNCADMMYSVGGITYNKNLVDKEHIPTSYEDMLDPYWEGKFLLTDPRATPAYMGWAAAVEAKYGIEYLEEVADQNPVLVDSASPGAQQVAAGAYYANMMAHLSNSTALRADGAPLGFVVMSDVPTGLPTCAGIPVDAPHPNAARLYMAYRLTAESQNLGCQAVEVGSALKDADECVELPEGWKPTDLAVMKDTAYQARLLSALGIE